MSSGNHEIGRIRVRAMIHINSYVHRALIQHLQNIPEKHVVEELIDLAHKAVLAGLTNTTVLVPVNTGPVPNNLPVPQPSIETRQPILSKEQAQRVFATPKR